MMLSFKRQQGLSIVELMVAMTLGLILTAGLAQIFVSNSKSFTVTEASMRLQETARMTTEFLNRSVRNADYWGCIPRDNVANKLDENHPAYQASEALFSYSEGFMAYQSDGTALGLSGTDALFLRGVGGAGGIEITEEMPNSSANLKVNTVNGLEESDILLISDCIAGDIFQVTGLQSGANPGINHNTGGSVVPGNGKPREGVDVVVDNNCPGGAVNCLSKQYDSAAQIFTPYFYQFYLAADASGRRALFRKDGSDAAQEIMDGVWDLQIRVGIDSGLSNGKVTQWTNIDGLNALTSSAAEDVVAVEMSLLARSPENNIVDEPMELCYPSWADCSAGPNYDVETKVGADSRHLYRVYTTTATIRNRILRVEQQ
ncbi:PilW family protein [Marinobacter salinisoli]|uniref:PilW family protein n=1 Tax=Marinobacter salinisoli TaxID=2769486 RepID=A0ABX7MUV9_9GAMM|nr:PilW family protein [Marinobacter salinisoli]QSP96126.1 PilW family protein [Marinobacter salinisoli]